MIDWSLLMGRSKDSSEVAAFVENIDPNAVIEPEDDVFYCSMYAQGCEIFFDENGFLKSIFFFAEGEQDARQYLGNLPENLFFNKTRVEARELLGIPDDSQEVSEHLGDKIPAWDRYKRSTYTLHITYSKNLGGVRLVTLDRL